MQDNLGALALGLMLGGMGLFTFMITPLAFKLLPNDLAGRYVRGTFPWYYAFTIGAGAFAIVGCVGHGPIASKIMTVVTILAIVQRQVLLPRINAARDGGDTEKRRFGLLHGAAVVINFGQILATIAAAIVYV
jgi:hypothetical protein